jgi:hypothetical protein
LPTAHSYQNALLGPICVNVRQAKARSRKVRVRNIRLRCGEVPLSLVAGSVSCQHVIQD